MAGGKATCATSTTCVTGTLLVLLQGKSPVARGKAMYDKYHTYFMNLLVLLLESHLMAEGMAMCDKYHMCFGICWHSCGEATHAAEGRLHVAMYRMGD